MKTLFGRIRMVLGTGGLTLALVGLFTATAGAKQVLCPAANAASLQTCINGAHTNNPVGLDTSSDTTIVTVAPGPPYQLTSQIRINNRKNLWIIGDTTATEANQPRILYQDTVHTYTDLDTAKRNDTSTAGTYGQNNGTVWIYMSSNILLEGLLIDGAKYSNQASVISRIFAYGATLGLGKTDEVRGNVGVNVLMSHAVQLRYLSVTNTWDGIAIVSPNLGGAFSYPDPNDPKAEVTATLPTSQAGLVGSHLVERCRIHDNTFGILCQRDWDLSSVFRNNLFWNNYLRHWADPRTSPGVTTGYACPASEYITHLCEIDTAVHADGSRRSLAYTTVGGAFLMTDVALTPYRIHNNTFFNNATTISGYYKTGTQHLFYNNLVGKPYQSFRNAVGLPVQAGSVNGAPWTSAYTGTERQSEMLQYFAEHERSNRVVDQDSIPLAANQTQVPNYWGNNGGNLRLFNMRFVHSPAGWPAGRTWTNNTPDEDSLTMTWVPDTTAPGTIAQIADSGGIVKWVRQNMWVGASPDPSTDPANNSLFNAHAPDNTNGSRWSPPWIPNNIRASLADGTIFRNTGAFDIRWTFGLPIDTTAATSATWLQPKALDAGQTAAKFLTGWPTYEGTATAAGVIKPLPIGAYDPATPGGWAAPARRLVLHDTLIESVSDSMVKFRLNVTEQGGLKDSDIVSLQVVSAKFYNNVPVSDTLYNQGPVAPASNLTTTRENSILSSTPWPLPYQFLTTDYDRAGYNVDDTLTKNLLGPNSEFLGRIGVGYRLNADSLYARAEVVLKATLKDGSVIYSNPGVFMFSRPRFQFVVTVTDANGNPLPSDPDGISQDVVAGEPLKVSVTAALVGTIPVTFTGYANMQIGNLGTLVGPDGNQFDKLPGQNLTGTNFAPVHANDTIIKTFLKNATVVGLYHAMTSPSDGTLTYTAVFQASDGSLLPYFIQGKSNPLKVLSGSIYQVTIDAVYRKTDTTLLASPNDSIKLQITNRDTILQSGADTSGNISSVYTGDTLRIVMQVRDKYGNPVQGPDSTSAKKGLYIKLAHDILPASRYPGLTTNASLLGIDTLGGPTWPDSIRISFDSTGRGTALVVVQGSSSTSILAALRASLMDSLGVEIGTAASSRDSGIADTTWLNIQPVAIGVRWVDTLTKKALAPITGYVGSWYPVQLESMNNGSPNAYTGSVPVTEFSSLHFHPAYGDTTTITSAVFAASAYSQVLWLRARDSTSVGWILTNSALGTDSVAPLKFSYPNETSAAFYDANCDGRIDSMVVKFDGPLSFRTPTGVVTGDSLDVLFPHQFLSPSAHGVPLRVTLRDSATLAFAWDPATIGAADARANRITVGNPLSGKAISYALPLLLDKAPPIAIKAADIQTWVASGAQDSLVVTFSEAINISNFVLGDSLPFMVRRGGVNVSLTGAHLTGPVQVLDSGVYAFVFQGPNGLVVPGDSIVIAGTDISDLAGNLSGTACPNLPVPTQVTPRFTPLPGYVIDVNGDGNADSVHLSFKDSLGTLPNTIFIEWGTPAETLTVTKAQLIGWGVTTSDSAFDVPVTTWHGQTVVIDGTTIHNAPRTVGELDTAIFNGVVGATLRDRVPPVLLYANLKYGPSVQVGQQGYDTVYADFSEAVSGCTSGTSASTCLSEKGTSVSNSAFPVGSTILKSYNNGTGWILLVPQGTVHVGDSARATPQAQSGMLVDASTNMPGLASPWVYVMGDPPPPNHGWMMDLNGDGKVDHVLLSFLNPPTVAKLPDYQFEWGNAAGTAVTLTSDSAYPIDSTRLLWMAVLATPGDFGATGYPPATQRMLGLQPTSTPYRFWVSDSTGPVLKPPATLKPSPDSAGSDTLIVVPSEALMPPSNSVLLQFKSGNHVIPADSVIFKSAKPSGNGTWTVILAPNSPYRPNPGDSVRLAPSVQDSTSSRNVPSPNEPWVPLTGNLRVPYAAYYYDANTDGRVDSVSLSFAVPPVVGSVVHVADPAGSGTFKSFTITPADAGLKVVSFSFDTSEWGQNVTGWSNTNLGTLLPPAGADTAIHGGPFAIQDKVAPVIVSAVMRYTSDTSTVDTLRITFSENVKLDTALILSQFKHSGNSSDTGTSVLPVWLGYDSATKVLTVYLRPVPSGDTLNPGVGDSLRLTFAVQDLVGNSPQTVAKWTVITGNRRVFPPIVTLSNPIVSNGNHAGDPVKDPTTNLPATTLPLVVRPSEPGNTGDWQILSPNGTVKGTGTSYKPGQPDYNALGSQGTVIFVQTNVPLNLTLYIYDNMGVYVTSVSQDITQAMLDQAEAAMASSGILLSKVGMVDVGLAWYGQDANGRQVASGIYPSRLIAYRNPTPEEKADGQTSPLMYNHLVRIGVKLSVK